MAAAEQQHARVHLANEMFGEEGAYEVWNSPPSRRTKPAGAQAHLQQAVPGARARGAAVTVQNQRYSANESTCRQ